MVSFVDILLSLEEFPFAKSKFSARLILLSLERLCRNRIHWFDKRLRTVAIKVL